MQFLNASRLEMRCSEALRYVETQLPPSKEATDLSTTLADAANELQVLRRMVHILGEYAISPPATVISVARAEAQNAFDKPMPAEVSAP